MGAIEHLTFPVRAELADEVRSRIADGTFADMSAFLEAALLSMKMDEHHQEGSAFTEHMRHEVRLAMNEYDSDPDTAYTVDDVLAHLRADAVADQTAR